MAVSYLHDTLLELAEMAIALRNGASRSRAVFMDEPGEHQFIVYTQGDRAEYEVRWYRGWASWGMYPETDFEVLLKGTGSVVRIVQQVTQVLWHIHQKIGSEKYKELRVEHDFPKENFKELVNE